MAALLLKTAKATSHLVDTDCIYPSANKFWTTFILAPTPNNSLHISLFCWQKSDLDVNASQKPSPICFSQSDSLLHVACKLGNFFYW